MRRFVPHHEHARVIGFWSASSVGDRRRKALGDCAGEGVVRLAGQKRQPGPTPCIFASLEVPGGCLLSRAQADGVKEYVSPRGFKISELDQVVSDFGQTFSGA